MIAFDLICPDEHRFEAWFKSGAAFDQQKAAGLLECPFCGSTDIKKAIMAPNVAAKGNSRSEICPSQKTRPSQAVHKRGIQGPDVNAAVAPQTDQASLAELRSEILELGKKIMQQVEKNCDNVGDAFPEEARKIHYGEAQERGIYGKASPQEAQKLQDEGIDLVPLPVLPKTDA